MFEFKILSYELRYQVKEILDTRSYMMGNKSAKVSNNFYNLLVDNKNYFDQATIFGLYYNNTLDVFSHMQPWKTSPYYSITYISSRKRKNRNKLPNGYDYNVTFHTNQRQAYLESQGYYLFYTQHNEDVKQWRRSQDNKFSRLYDYEIDIAERIPAGNISKYKVFTDGFLGCNPQPMDTIIISHYLPKEKRGNYDPSIVLP